jgi:hypothetical protein
MRVATRVTLVALAATLLAAPAAFAQSEDEKILEQGGTTTPPPASDDGDYELSTTYSSIGLQKVAADFENVEDAINLDITMIGFRIPTVPWFGIELNLGFTMAPGQIDPNGGTPGDPGNCVLPDFPPGCTPATEGTAATGSGDFTSTNIGAFAVLRSTGSLFAMGKLGYRYMNTSIEQLQDDRSGTAYGLGVGYRWNKKGSYAEFGYTKWAEKIDALGISISYSYDRR